MSLSARPSLSLLAALSALVPAVLCSSAGAAETLKLDLRNPNNAIEGGVSAQTSSPLVAGAPYVVTVSGTGTIWSAEQTAKGICGLAEAAPLVSSPGQAPRAATWDAATVFAAPIGVDLKPLGAACGPVAPPISTAPLVVGFQFKGAGDYARPNPIGGKRTVPRSDHTYSYDVTGDGSPLSFQFRDWPADDNSGVFTITVRTQAECDAVNCLSNSQPQSDQVAAPAVAAAAGSVGVLGSRITSSCKLQRVLSVRLNSLRAGTFEKVVFFLQGERVRTVKGRKIYIGATNRIRAQKFRNLPTTAMKVDVQITTDRGQRATVTKTFPQCNPRIKARPISSN